MEHLDPGEDAALVGGSALPLRARKSHHTTPCRSVVFPRQRMHSSSSARRPALRLAPDREKQLCSHGRARKQASMKPLFSLVYVVSSPSLVTSGCSVNAPCAYYILLLDLLYLHIDDVVLPPDQ